MARKLLKVPDDVTFQMTSNLPPTWNEWTTKEFTCEQYPDLRIRVHARPDGTDKFVQYIAHNVGHKTLQGAYTTLKERPHRTRYAPPNKPRRHAHANRADRAAKKLMFKTPGRRSPFD